MEDMEQARYARSGGSPTTLAECVKRLRVAPSLAIVGTGTANTCYLRLRS